MGRSFDELMKREAPEKTTSASDKTIDPSAVVGANPSNYSSKLNKDLTPEQRSRDLYNIASMLAQERAQEKASEKRYWRDRPTSKRNLRESTASIYNDMVGDDAELMTADEVLGIKPGTRNARWRKMSEGMDDLGGFLGTGIDWAFDNSIGSLVGMIGGEDAGNAVRNFATGDQLSWIPGAALDIGALALTGGAAAPAVAYRNAIENYDNFANWTTGVDQITGQELNEQQRNIAGLAGTFGTALSAIPGTAAVRGVGKVAANKAGQKGIERATTEGNKLVEAAEGLLKGSKDKQVKYIERMKKLGLTDDEIKKIWTDAGFDEKALVGMKDAADDALTKTQQHVHDERAKAITKLFSDNKDLKDFAKWDAKRQQDFMKVLEDSGVDISDLDFASDFMGSYNRLLPKLYPDALRPARGTNRFDKVDDAVRNGDEGIGYADDVAKQTKALESAKAQREAMIKNMRGQADDNLSGFNRALGFWDTRIGNLPGGYSAAIGDTSVGRAMQTPVKTGYLPRAKNVADAILGRPAFAESQADKVIAETLKKGNVSGGAQEIKELAKEAAKKEAERGTRAGSAGYLGANLGSALLQNSANLGSDSDNIYEDTLSLIDSPNGWASLAQMLGIGLLGRRPGFRTDALLNRGVSKAARYGMQGDLFMRALREAMPELDDESLLELYYMLMGGTNGTAMTPEQAKKSATEYRNKGEEASSEKSSDKEGGK